MAREIFLDELNTDAAVLPRIIALGDIDEDELAFAQAATPGLRRMEISTRDGRLAAPPAAGAADRAVGQANPAARSDAGAAGDSAVPTRRWRWPTTWRG